MTFNDVFLPPVDYCLVADIKHFCRFFGCDCCRFHVPNVPNSGRVVKVLECPRFRAPRSG